jgi:hypothetical protein
MGALPSVNRMMVARVLRTSTVPVLPAAAPVTDTPVEDGTACTEKQQTWTWKEAVASEAGKGASAWVTAS